MAKFHVTRLMPALCGPVSRATVSPAAFTTMTRTGLVTADAKRY
jgi:hypothetical protein